MYVRTLRVKITCPKSRVLLSSFAASITRIYCARARGLLMAVLAKVSTLCERLPSVLVDPCLYYCCTAHQALAALRSLCTEGCARTARSTCVGVRNVIREFIWTAATVLFAQVRTGYFDAYCMSSIVIISSILKKQHEVRTYACTCTYVGCA